LTHRLDQSLLGASADLPERRCFIFERASSMGFYGPESREASRGELAAPLLDELLDPSWTVSFKRLSITTT
jgi:hypothetical protein